MEPSVTTLAVLVCVSQVTQAKCVKPVSAQRESMALSVTRSAHAMPQTPKGKAFCKDVMCVWLSVFCIVFVHMYIKVRKGDRKRKLAAHVDMWESV